MKGLLSSAYQKEVVKLMVTEKCTIYDCEFDLFVKGVIIDNKVYAIDAAGNPQPAKDHICEHVDCGRVQFFIPCKDNVCQEEYEGRVIGTCNWLKEPSNWGFFKFSTGEIIVPPIYDYAGSFYFDRAQVEKDGKFGLIDPYGSLILNIEWDSIKNLLRYKDQMYVVEKNGKFGLSDKYGNLVLTVDWEEIDHAGDCGHENTLYVVKRNGKYGYADKDGKLVVPPNDDKVEYFYEGFAVAEKDGKWGYINPQGQYVIDPIFAEAGHFCRSSFLVDGRESLFGTIAVAPVNFEGMWGLINTKGEYIIQPQFEEIGEVGFDYLVVKKDGIWGYVDNKLNQIMAEKNCNYIIYGGKKLCIKNGRISSKRKIKA